ncbi:MAG: adenylyl-sulfate reductase subunit alpha [Deltaproteobacteria bacterium]|nr:adenylyl-sulfate reductase subunit alpha [Deltaproteobacteria bacterium]
MSTPPIHEIKTDILIIGGGAAGCMAAIIAKEKAPQLDVTILEKAHIERSGCLAMGLNAINAHLYRSTPEEYTAYVKKDNYDIVRDDLVLSIGKRLNRMTDRVEQLGVPLPRDHNGNHISRSPRSIVMLGEQLKPLLANAVSAKGVRILNRTPVYRLLFDSQHQRISGAAGLNLRTNRPVIASARAVIVTSGGTSGIYRPTNPGLARTKTWYCPYNAGSGLSMGLRAGAEMTSFEMRFVALRTKDVIAPTGTLVLGTSMPQCNARDEHYIKNKAAMLGRKLTTCERLLYTIEEHKKGTGPCYIDVSGLTPAQYNSLVESYLNMAPSIVLDLLQDPRSPRTHIEICGSEPYINGGHGMSGYWIDLNRRTTLPGLYAAGDIAGGAPKKYVTGCFAEAEMAVEDILTHAAGAPHSEIDAAEAHSCVQELISPLNSAGDITFSSLEERIQKIMEEYAGGSTQNYETSREKLMLAKQYLNKLSERTREIRAADYHALMRVHDSLDRLLLARVLVEHMLARRETRWPCYQTRLDYPIRNDLEFKTFINSRFDDGSISVFKRSLQPPHTRTACKENTL